MVNTGVKKKIRYINSPLYIARNVTINLKCFSIVPLTYTYLQSKYLIHPTSNRPVGVFMRRTDSEVHYLSSLHGYLET